MKRLLLPCLPVIALAACAMNLAPREAPLANSASTFSPALTPSPHRDCGLIGCPKPVLPIERTDGARR